MRLILATILLATAGSAMGENLRMPLALELLANRETLVVGCKDGSVVAIDTRSGRIRQIVETGGSITDLAKLSDTGFLATDFANGELLRFQLEGGNLELTDRKKVSEFPVSISLDPWKKRAFIADKWQQRLISIQINPSLQVRATRELSFIPREQILLANGAHLLVADAHGENLALLDAETLELRAVHRLPGHNIRGLALNPEGDHVFISHQRLNPLARTTFDDLHWGMTMNNVVRKIPVSALLDPDTNLAQSSEIWNLGTVGNGAGDPDELAFRQTGDLIVTVAGTGQIFWGEFGDSNPKRIETGARPTAVALDEFAERIYVANSLDDLISVLDFDRKQLIATISLARQNLMISAADRGQRLFFNARLSHDGWMSCHSCHTNGHTNEQLADTFGDRSFGTTKRVPSLLGRAQTAPFGWLGNKPTLAKQVEVTLETTMHHRGESFSRNEVQDLVAFLETLPSPPQFGDSTAANHGRVLFAELNCVKCHAGNTLTSIDAFDVGVRDEDGNVEFNPPSLLGIRFQSRFFHDGRFDSLESVFTVGRHQLDRELTTNELNHLTEFLRSL
tara:strand:- start:11039 stop:12733 length:1695 start_codon:yes stop_codon:yes gene_type:complete